MNASVPVFERMDINEAERHRSRMGDRVECNVFEHLRVEPEYSIEEGRHVLRTSAYEFRDRSTFTVPVSQEHTLCTEAKPDEGTIPDHFLLEMRQVVHIKTARTCATDDLPPTAHALIRRPPRRNLALDLEARLAVLQNHVGCRAATQVGIDVIDNSPDSRLIPGSQVEEVRPAGNRAKPRRSRHIIVQTMPAARRRRAKGVIGGRIENEVVISDFQVRNIHLPSGEPLVKEPDAARIHG